MLQLNLCVLRFAANVDKLAPNVTTYDDKVWDSLYVHTRTPVYYFESTRLLCCSRSLEYGTLDKSRGLMLRMLRVQSTWLTYFLQRLYPRIVKTSLNKWYASRVIVLERVNRTLNYCDLWKKRAKDRLVA